MSGDALPTVLNLRVLILGPDPLARGGLAAMLAHQPGYAVVGHVDRADDVSASVDIFSPDVLLWDLGPNPSAAIADLEDSDDGIPPVLALLPDGYFTREARSAGAQGLLPRDSDTPSLLAALTAVARGLVVLAREMESASKPAPTPTPDEVLTPREQEVLRLLSEGMTNKEMAYRLEISEHTVKFHVNSILGKLGVQSRTEAAIQAARLGLIHL